MAALSRLGLRRALSRAVAASSALAIGRQSLPSNASAPQADHKPSPAKHIVTKNSDYIQGMKIYDIGILEDPVPGEKRGRGIQHLTSSYWIYDMGVFINREFEVMQAMVRYCFERSQIYPGYDFRYFTNVSNALFLKAEAEGLRTKDGRDFFLMAAWCAMAAAEVDGFQYGKYSDQQRAAHRNAFYDRYLYVDVVWPLDEKDDPELEASLGKFCIEGCRIDLLPSVALERLGIHNELCSLKWSDPIAWMKEGFVVSKRIDSMKRHYESIHARDATEDHIAHLIWGFMAVTHVVACFPHCNDLFNFEVVRRRNVLAMDENTRALVGDGGFRAARHGQSARRIDARFLDAETEAPVATALPSVAAQANTELHATAHLSQQHAETPHVPSHEEHRQEQRPVRPQHVQVPMEAS